MVFCRDGLLATGDRQPAADNRALDKAVPPGASRYRHRPREHRWDGRLLREPDTSRVSLEPPLQ